VLCCLFSFSCSSLASVFISWSSSLFSCHVGGCLAEIRCCAIVLPFLKTILGVLFWQIVVILYCLVINSCHSFIKTLCMLYAESRVEPNVIQPLILNGDNMLGLCDPSNLLLFLSTKERHTLPKLLWELVKIENNVWVAHRGQSLPYISQHSAHSNQWDWVHTDGRTDTPPV